MTPETELATTVLLAVCGVAVATLVAVCVWTAMDNREV